MHASTVVVVSKFVTTRHKREKSHFIANMNNNFMCAHHMPEPECGFFLYVLCVCFFLYAHIVTSLVTGTGTMILG